VCSFLPKTVSNSIGIRRPIYKMASIQWIWGTETTSNKVGIRTTQNACYATEKANVRPLSLCLPLLALGSTSVPPLLPPPLRHSARRRSGGRRRHVEAGLRRRRGAGEASAAARPGGPVDGARAARLRGRRAPRRTTARRGERRAARSSAREAAGARQIAAEAGRPGRPVDALGRRG